MELAWVGLIAIPGQVRGRPTMAGRQFALALITKSLIWTYVATTGLDFLRPYHWA